MHFKPRSNRQTPLLPFFRFWNSSPEGLKEIRKPSFLSSPKSLQLKSPQEWPSQVAPTAATSRAVDSVPVPQRRQQLKRWPLRRKIVADAAAAN